MSPNRAVGLTRDSGRQTVEYGSRTSLVERFPFLKGSRLGFGVTNLFDSRTEVTSSDGATPINYQADYLDPQGRVFRVNLRKILF